MEASFSKKKFGYLSLVLAAVITSSILATTVFSMQPLAARVTPSGSPSHTTHFMDKVSGKVAWADWYMDEDSNGIYTSAYLLVSDRTTHSGSNNNPEAVVEASVYQYRLEQTCDVDENGETYCYDEEIPVYSFFGCKELSKPEFSISSNLLTAILNTELSGCDYYADEDYQTSDNEQSLIIRATWTGYGETFKGRDRYSTSNNFERVTEYSIGSFKQANAKASFVGDDISLNLDQDSGIGEAYLSKSQNGYFERIRIDPS